MVGPAANIVSIEYDPATNRNLLQYSVLRIRVRVRERQIGRSGPFRVVIRTNLNQAQRIRRQIIDQVEKSQSYSTDYYDIMTRYDAAKDEQAFVEGRIRTLEQILKNAQLIETTGDNDKIVLGCRVTVREEGYDPETFHIVGSTEADPSKGRISNESPLGQAILGRRVNDVIEVNTPGGVSTFTILNIE